MSNDETAYPSNAWGETTRSESMSLLGVDREIDPDTDLSGVLGGGVKNSAPVSLVVGSINAQDGDPADHDLNGISGMMYLLGASGHDVVNMIGSDDNPGATTASYHLGSDRACYSTEECMKPHGDSYDPGNVNVVCERNGFVPDPSAPSFDIDNPGRCVPESFHRSKHALLQNGIFVHRRPDADGDAKLGLRCDPATDAGCAAANALHYSCKNTNGETIPGDPNTCGGNWVGEKYDVVTHRMVGFRTPAGDFYQEGNNAGGAIRLTTTRDAIVEKAENELTVARVMENVVGPLMSSSDVVMNSQYGTNGIKLMRNDDQTLYSMQFIPRDTVATGATDATDATNVTAASHLVCQTMPASNKPAGTDSTGDDYNLVCGYWGPHVGGVFDSRGLIGLAYDPAQGKYTVDVNSSLTQGKVKFDGAEIARDNGEYYQVAAQCENVSNYETYSPHIDAHCAEFPTSFPPAVMNAIQTQPDNEQIDTETDGQIDTACPHKLTTETHPAFLEGLHSASCPDDKSACCAYLASWIGGSADAACPMGPEVNTDNLQSLRSYQAANCSGA